MEHFNIVEECKTGELYLSKMKCKIGMIECYELINRALRLPSIIKRLEELHEYLETESLIDKPLIELNTADSTIEVRLAKSSTLVMGEFVPIRQLMGMLNDKDKLKLREDLEFLENELIKNSILVYDAIVSHTKETVPMIKFLQKGKKEEYLYYYPKLRKLDSLQFVAYLVETKKI